MTCAPGTQAVSFALFAGKGGEQERRSILETSIGWLLLLQVVLIFLNAVFACAEIAVLSVNEVKLNKMCADGNRKAKRLSKLTAQPAKFLATIQVAITLAGFLGSAFAAENFSDPLVDWLIGLGVTIPPATLNTLVVILITLILSYFTLVFGELVPKRIAMQKPLKMARLSCGVVSSLATVMKPVVRFLSFSTNAVLRLLRMKTEAESETVTEEEIRMMVDLGEERGTINRDEGEWIDNVFEFGETTVREVMTHVIEVVAVPADAAPDDVLKTIRESGCSRIPVYGKNIDDVLGILNAREFLLERRDTDTRIPEHLIHPAYFVPETLRAATLFKDMQQKKQHIAIVVDEYGQTGGIVTMEDLLEEIVGSIYDEFDTAEEPPVQKLGENLWRALGSARLDEISDATGVSFPEDADFDTLNGLILSRLNNIPRDGTTLDLEAFGLQIHVEKIAHKCVVSATLSLSNAPTFLPEAV